jgi:hypothetical protein
MKTIATIVALAAGVSAFALTASAENTTIQARAHTSKASQSAVVSGLTNDFQSGFIASGTGKQPAWVTYGSLRK